MMDEFSKWVCVSFTVIVVAVILGNAVRSIGKSVVKAKRVAIADESKRKKVKE